MVEVKSEQVRIVSDPPTVDIKSKKAKDENSGSIILNPPTAGMGAKGN